MEVGSKELKALTVILRASQAIQEAIRKSVASYKLNATELSVLEFLYHKGDQPIQTVGKKILISSSSITYVIDKLEKKQLVTRRDCPNDRRITYASLTKKGQELMEQVFPILHEQMLELFDSIDEQQLIQLINIMKQIGIRAEKM
ncbi:MarR family winged helix-turn-helix transcriptional regulator [Rummeliibacillus sp. JY-2-4R]